MTNQLGFWKFVTESCKKEQENGLNVGAETYVFVEFHVKRPTLKALNGPLDPALHFSVIYGQVSI